MCVAAKWGTRHRGRITVRGFSFMQLQFSYGGYRALCHVRASNSKSVGVGVLGFMYLKARL